MAAVRLAFACSLAPGQAEVLAINSTSAISGRPPMSRADVIDEAEGGGVETESDLDRGTLAVAVAREASTWATTLLSLAGFGP
jgi:hypothetical protein